MTERSSIVRAWRGSACAAFLALSSVADAQDRSIRLADFYSALELGSDGVLDVTERLTFEFRGQWNGIIRDLSLRHNTAQGRSDKLDLDVGSITDAAGRPLRVEHESEDGMHKLRIYIPEAVDTQREIVIRYRVSNAVRFFYEGSSAGALDELYWNVTGNSWDMPIAKARARVVLPAGARATRVAAYTGATGSTAAEADIDNVGTVVTMTSRRELQPYEGMTIGVGWAPGYVASRPSDFVHRTQQIVRWWPLLLPFPVFFLALRSWRKRGKDPEDGTITVQYEPVDGMSPAEIGTLADHRAEMRDITSTLVDLAVRGFVRIHERRERKLLGLLADTDYEFFLLKPRGQWTGLVEHEKRYLDALFDDSESVKLSDLKDKFYKKLPKIRHALYEQLIARGHYLRRPDRVQHLWLGGAAVTLAAGVGAVGIAAGQGWAWISTGALAAAGVVSALVLVVFGMIMPARTPLGARARESALGFREFLSRVETDRYKRMITSPEMFERFLPFAMAFDVEKKWAKAFEDIYTTPPSWYTGGSAGHFNASVFSSRMSSLSTSASSTMSSSPSSSGSSGGGSSGGGSGGGGGSGF